MNRGAEGAALGGFFPSAAAVFMVSSVETTDERARQFTWISECRGPAAQGSPGAAVKPGHQMGSFLLFPPGWCCWD